MNRYRQSPRLSLLDRLIDMDAGLSPRSTRSGADESGSHACLGRDLENLLNSRCRVLSPPGMHPHLQQSLLVYGLRDLVTVNLSDAKSRQDFAEEVQRLIHRFEPRLVRVQVSFPPQFQEATGHSVRFRIDALILQDPAPEPVIFNSVMEPGSCSVRVEEAFYV